MTQPLVKATQRTIFYVAAISWQMWDTKPIPEVGLNEEWVTMSPFPLEQLWGF